MPTATGGPEPHGATPHPAGATGAARRAIQAYYLATPLFAAMDLAGGVNLRTAFMDSGPAARLAYYAAAFAIGLAAARWPARAHIAAVVESGIDIGWLAIGVGTRYLAALEEAGAENTLPGAPFAGLEVANLLLSALVLAVGYIAAMARAGRNQAIK